MLIRWCSGHPFFDPFHSLTLTPCLASFLRLSPSAKSRSLTSPFIFSTVPFEQGPYTVPRRQSRRVASVFRHEHAILVRICNR